MATEKRLIDANALIESGYDLTLDKVFPDWHELPVSVKEAVCKHGQYLKKLINEQPTVDAVEVVRCKECKQSMLWCKPTDKVIGECFIRKMNSEDEQFCMVGADDFCSYGERKDNG